VPEILREMVAEMVPEILGEMLGERVPEILGEMLGLWGDREGVCSMPEIGGHVRAASMLGPRGLVGLSRLSAPDRWAHRRRVGAVVRREVSVSLILCNGGRVRRSVVRRELFLCFPVKATRYPAMSHLPAQISCGATPPHSLHTEL
jgi:hypothetical protein